MQKSILQQTITTLIEHLPHPQLREATENLSLRYRDHEKPYLREKSDYLAYLITRLPATLAAIQTVFKAIPTHGIQSFLDLGAGPGTGYLAAKEIFPGLTKITLLETDSEFIRIGKTLITDDITWQQAQLPCLLSPHDLVLMSYSLGEMPQIEKIIHDAFAACNQFLVLIEPGTPEGYARIMKARDQLLSQGAHMVAPCPNALPCPMEGTDWCHFPARVERSSLHRQLKSGSLGFEDEKFSYLIVAKENIHLPAARIIRKPQIHSGHVQLTLCTEGKIQQTIVTKKEKDFYKKCRKSNWGDTLEPPN